LTPVQNALYSSLEQVFVAVVHMSGNGCVISIKDYKNHQRAYAERVDIVIIAMIKSLRFVPKSDAAHTGWLAFDWTEITEPVTLSQIAGG